MWISNWASPLLLELIFKSNNGSFYEQKLQILYLTYYSNVQEVYYPLALIMGLG